MERKSYYQIFKNEGVSFGWKHAKKDFFFFLQIFALLAIANALPDIINLIMHRPHDTNNIGTIIAAILSLIFGFGMLKLYLHFVHGKEHTITDLWNHNRGRFAWWLLSKIIHGALIGVGVVLLIIPGIYVAARLYLYEYFVIDQKMDAIEAISASWEVTAGHVWEIIGIWFISLGILILGVIPLGIGLLWAVPTVELAKATLYKKLTSHDQHLE